MAQKRPNERAARCKERDKRHGTSIASLGAPLSQHLKVFTYPEALQRMEALMSMIQ